MKLSIITPYYRTLEELKRLANVLIPQLTNNTEWIIVNDGCPPAQLTSEIMKICDKYNNYNTLLIHLDKNSGGASIPRNKGLDIAQGEYIVFIDADDLVSHNYIRTILDKTKEEWEYCYFSFEMMGKAVIIENEPPSWNCCIWNCIYKKELIGEERFDPKLILAEDYDFNKRVRKGKKANITDMIYYYQNTPGSLTKIGKRYNDNYEGDDK